MFLAGLNEPEIAPRNINLETGGEVSFRNQIPIQYSKVRISKEKKLPLGVFARFSR
ncbi:hypothetical protein SAMN05216323_10722 [Williamwhitmania taraxaci]|uniref:Uncharacterized protein n=1 Tax=Williamwhitmania taraxaci TaxID=1640674 RepID=A0A1G6RC73_9BACT|nr:hypothetical protein SAMN05216323_10722 [Williamwhitmania taraxaci]